MATLSLTTHFTVDIDDDDSHTITGGSTTATDSFTITHYFDRRYSIASGNAYLTEIWSDAKMAGVDPASTTIGNFDFLWIESDQPVELQLLCNEGGTAALSVLENAFVVKLIAGVPFILGADDSRNRGDVIGAASFTQANYMTETDDWESTWSADIIDRIECLNSSGSEANVRVFAAT